MKRMLELGDRRIPQPARSGTALAAALHLALSTLAAPVVLEAQVPVDDPEQAVYAAVLADYVPERRSTLLLVRDSTARAGFFEARAAEEMSDVSEALREEFLARTRTSVPLRIREDAVRVPLWTLTREELFSFPRTREGIWIAFDAAYPSAGGYVELSRVAFTPDGDEALVKLEVSCGSLCGSSTLLYLRRVDGRWRIMDRNVFVMS